MDEAAHPLALVVDDEEILRLFAAGLLEEHGFDVMGAEKAAAALRVATRKEAAETGFEGLRAHHEVLVGGGGSQVPKSHDVIKGFAWPSAVCDGRLAQWLRHRALKKSVNVTGPDQSGPRRPRVPRPKPPAGSKPSLQGLGTFHHPSLVPQERSGGAGSNVKTGCNVVTDAPAEAKPWQRKILESLEH